MATSATQTDRDSDTAETISDVTPVSPDNGRGHCYNRQLLAKYSGHKTIIRADMWISLFEVITRDKDDSYRIFEMMAYLTDDALNWFATDIAPKLDNIKWKQVKDEFIARFGPAIANPLVESQHRRLKFNENVQQYYDDKMRILRRIQLQETDVVAQLTEGMPPQYRGYLLCANPNNAVAWLAVALQLEATIGRKQSFEKPNQNPRFKQKFKATGIQTALVSANRNNPRPNRSQSARPSTPCRYCSQAGETVYHWHRDCPRTQNSRQTHVNPRQAQQEPEAEAPVLLAENTIALSNDLQGNFPGGHH